MTWTATAIVGGSVIGAIGSNMAAGKAASGQDAAARTQLGMFNQTQENLAPWMRQGQLSLAELGREFGGVNSPGNAPFDLTKFQASPAYNFNLQQGQQAIDKASAARGNYYAPQTLQDVGRFSQGLASNEFQNAFSNYNTMQNNLFSRLQTLSGSGQNAAANLGGFAAQTAGQIGASQIGAANANAAGILGVGNAINNGLGQFANNQLMQQMLAQQQSPIYTTTNNSPGVSGSYPYG